MLASVIRLQNWFGDTSEQETKTASIPADQETARSVNSTLEEIQKTKLIVEPQYYNASPYTVYPEYPPHKSTVTQTQADLQETKQSNTGFAFQCFYRLTGLWFVTVAAGSVLCSIPISAMGLPIILGFGIISMVAVAIFSYIVKFWIKILAMIWRAFKAALLSPTYLVGMTGSLIRKVTHMIFNRNNIMPVEQQQYPVFPSQNRRFSNSSRLTDRSFDGIFI